MSRRCFLLSFVPKAGKLYASPRSLPPPPHLICLFCRLLSLINSRSPFPSFGPTEFPAFNRPHFIRYFSTIFIQAIYWEFIFVCFGVLWQSCLILVATATATAGNFIFWLASTVMSGVPEDLVEKYSSV